MRVGSRAGPSEGVSETKKPCPKAILACVGCFKQILEPQKADLIRDGDLIHPTYCPTGRELLDVCGRVRPQWIYSKPYSVGIEEKVAHRVFPGGPPSKYYPGPTMLNFRDLTRTGVVIVVWRYPLGLVVFSIL